MRAPQPRHILIDVGHPADLHRFRHLTAALREKGWNCLVVAKDKDVLLPLLKAFELPYTVLAANKGGVVSKLLNLPAALCRFYRVARRFRPAMAVSSASLHCSWICALLRIPHLAFIDTEPRKLVDALTLPLLQARITPFSYRRDLGADHIRYAGNHELAYLHPRRFQPDPAIRKELGLAVDEPFVLVRFVAWKASHDIGLPHMSEAERLELVRLIAGRKRLFITSETPLPEPFGPWLFPLPPERIHHALAFADFYVGEGITMASEAAVLGTPAVLLNILRMGYCQEAEEKGMLFSFPALTAGARHKIGELLEMPDIRAAFAAKHQAFLAGKIDVTAFMTWFIDCYPECLARMRKDPGYAGRFV